MKAATASGVERKVHGKALQMLWPATATKEVPSRDGSPYHWILASAAERVESPLCTPPHTPPPPHHPTHTHKKPFPHRFIVSVLSKDLR